MSPRLCVFLSISAIIVTPNLAHAVEMGNIQVQSALDEPFRAKVPLKKISKSVKDLNFKQASTSEYKSKGLTPTNVDLKYRVQDNGDGTGVLWVSSNKVIKEPFLDIVVNAQDNGKQSQHKISALVNPNTVFNDTFTKPLPNLMKPKKSENEFVLQPTKTSPPPLFENPKVSLPKVATNNTKNPTKAQPAQINQSTTSQIDVNNPFATNNSKNTSSNLKKKVTQPKNSSKSTVTKGSKAISKETSKYLVVKRDTLWNIANKIAKEKGLSVTHVMRDIQANNKHAFIGNNINRLKTGVVLVVPEFIGSRSKNASKTVQVSQKKVSKKKASKQTSKPVRKKNTTVINKKPKVKIKTVKPKVTTNAIKPEMKIIAENKKGSGKGEDKGASKQTNSTLPPQIISQINNSRKSVINKRKRVNQLNTELNSFNDKLQVQNTKLAKLEERLKQLSAKKNTSKEIK